MKFRTTLLQGDKTATGFEVPADVVAALGSTNETRDRRIAKILDELT